MARIRGGKNIYERKVLRGLGTHENHTYNACGKVTERELKLQSYMLNT